jgi:hypothetical protein
MAFTIPRLTPSSFLGNGLCVERIDNPSLAAPSAAGPVNNDPYKRMAWVDAERAVYFNIRAENADKTVPIVLRECHR